MKKYVTTLTVHGYYLLSDEYPIRLDISSLLLLGFSESVPFVFHKDLLSYIEIGSFTMEVVYLVAHITIENSN